MPAWPELSATLREQLADVPASRRVVACSGGLDSSVLMASLAKLHAEDGLPPPRALHVDHGLHPDSSDFARATLRRCVERGVACEVIPVSVAPGAEGLEAAARRARYEAFAEALGDGEVLLLAHHRDDQAETVLLRLLRGAGPAGLSGMPVTRRLGRGFLLRPLLGLDRGLLAKAASELAVEVSEDPSNAELRQDRNFLRHRVLPQLEQRWPGYRRTFSRAAELCAEQEAALAELLGPAPQQLPVADLAGAPAIAGVRLRHWLAAKGAAMPNRARIDALLAQIHAREDARVRVDLGGVSVRRFAGKLHLVSDDLPELPHDVLTFCPPASLDLPHGRLRAEMTDGAGLRPLAGGYQVRFRQGGERLQPAGRQGTRRLKDLLQEAAVPPWERDRLPLVYAGSTLVAIADLYLAEGWRTAPGEPGWCLIWQTLPPG